MYKKCKRLVAATLAVCLSVTALSGCGNQTANQQKTTSNVTAASLKFPLAKTETLTGLTTYPVGSESKPNNRTIFQRLEKASNVHINWTAIQNDQWGDKAKLLMASGSGLQDFVFNADFSDSDLLKYANQGAIVHLEDYIDKYMPNLKAVFAKYPVYKKMCMDEDGHIWGLPWIEQLGTNKEAIQTVGNMAFINKKWLSYLKLKTPTTVDELEQTLLQFKEHAGELQKQFKIDGSILPMSCIINDQDPALIINGFGKGYGDNDLDRHIAVSDDGKVICTATQEGYKKGINWLHKLYTEGLLDKESFTQKWATYVSKGKAGRYGVCFSWDVANVDNLKDWEPLPALKADTTNITPCNTSYTSGFARGKCVITSACKNVPLACAWLDQMYAPLQSPQNNWGTYGETKRFNIFKLSKNTSGGQMLKHIDLGSQSPVEVRDAQSVGGPLAVLNDYYNTYVTCPDDAAYRLKWIKDIYTPQMHHKYVYPNAFMSVDDTQKLSDLQADIKKYINNKRSGWILNGGIDHDWNGYMNALNKYGLSDYLKLLQKYYDKSK